MSYFQNLGYLYPLGMAGDGKVFYCPAYSEKGDPDNLPLSADFYAPLLTSRPASTDGTTTTSVRSSYVWNPWSRGQKRLYQKTSDFKESRVLLMEYLLNDGADVKSPLNPQTVAHSRSRTLTVAYSDNAVQQLRITPVMWALTHVGSGTEFLCSANGNPFPDYTNFLSTIEALH